MSVRGAPSPAAGIMIAAGGTGGHLFPALALAQELARRARRVDLFTDARGHRFGARFPAANVYEVPSASLSLKAPQRIPAGLARLCRGTLTVRRILAEAKPAAVIGFGSYPSLPPLLAANLARIPTCVHEQNAVMGRANRLLAPLATAVALSFSETARVPGRARARARVIGNPVRDDVLRSAGAPYAGGKPGRRFRLLVFGGSQGAQLFSDVVPAAIVALPRASRAGLEVVQQCREEDVRRVRQAYEANDIRAEVAGFFGDLPKRMARAHLVVCRSGASTIAELGVLGRPAVLVPLPHSIDNDQLMNARAFAKAGGGWVVEQREFTPERLSALITQLRFAPEELEAAARMAAGFGRADAVTRLADLVEEIALKPAPAGTGAGSAGGKQARRRRAGKETAS